MSLVTRSLRIKAVNFAFVFAAPVVVAIVALATYLYTGNQLTSAKSFTILSVFNTLRYPLLMLPQAVKSFSGARVSIDRITRYMLQSDVQEVPNLPPNKLSTTTIKMNGAQFTWDGEKQPSLTDVSFEVQRGEILAVIGDVGSGKSSLIAALLGQIKQTGGPQIEVHGTTSYVPQEAWLLNFTLRDNILFGKDYVERQYNEVIRVCALERDLTLLAAGDQTEIAERGANLSGGQRQRSSLARAVYADADIILLDDPLSAVDQAVGRHIFDECIKGHLKGKTIIMATHQLQYLEHVDKVLQLKDGKIERFGRFSDLMAQYPDFEEMIMNHVSAGEGDDDVEAMPLAPMMDNHTSFPAPKETNQGSIELNQLTVKSMRNLQINEQTISSMIERNQLSVLRNAGQSHDVADVVRRNELTIHSVKDLPDMQNQADHDSINDNDDDDDDDDTRKAGQLISEDRSADSIGWADYIRYARSGNGTGMTIFTIAYFFVVHGVRISSDYWLRLWIPNSLNLDASSKDGIYVGVYAGFIALFAAGVLSRGLLFAREASKKADVLHEKMFARIMRAPMSFFDTTPIGRILSAFSKHVYSVDESMPDSAMQALQYVPLTLGALMIVMIIVPWNWAPVLGLIFLAAICIWWVTPAENALKAAEASSKPPIFSHLAATLEGLFSIRAYRAQARFDALNMAKLDGNHELFLALSLLKSWTALYMDIITSFVIYSTALFMVLFRDDGLGRTDKEKASNAGLALSNALQILVFLQWSIRMIGEVQGQISSVGIITYYSDVAQEAPAVKPDYPCPAGWPSEGHIQFKDVVLKYQEFGVEVLKKVTFNVKPSEKIGIVGRTGSGKSTLLVALLRIVELYGGAVTIDDVDVSKLGLDDLRQQVAIIPQEAILFKGTIRSNLDPFHKSTDELIWRALDAVSLGEKIRAMPSKLDSEVTENGKNFSLGQRQLFCIARAVLSDTKVLVLDEATASIDMQTDAMIQKAIKDNFAHLTVLTIAHRLNTVVECDKILVMEGGNLMEFDEPIKLIDQGGHFASLVNNTGPDTAKKLRDLALAASEERRAAQLKLNS
jgi:ABC-type multidrug transport system fused ATPase/permease subunit